MSSTSSFFKFRYVPRVLKASVAPGIVIASCIAGQFILDLVHVPSAAQSVSLHILKIGLIIGATWLGGRALGVARTTIYELYDTSIADNIRQRRLRTQIDFIHRLILIVLCLVSVSIILMTFDGARRIGASLIASAGVASIVIGFAAQRSLANLIAGFQIAFTQPLRLDDVVIVEKEWGRIEEITLTYVVVKIWDLRRMVLPITYFVEKPFENWTRTSSEILGTAMFYVDYNFPVENFRQELNRVIKTTPLWNGKVCGLQVTDLNDRVMELRVLVSARNASEAFDLRCYLRETLIGYIQKNYPDALPQRRELKILSSDNSPAIENQSPFTGNPR